MSTFKQDTEETPVLFRRWPRERVITPTGKSEWAGGDVIAVFPTHTGTNESHTCSSFAHVGQHGSADHGIMHRTRRAKPGEYADLKKELESAPYGYRLKVYSRWQSSFDVVRKAELARV